MEDGVVYGPVDSRRLGRSLGIDLSPPGVRACNFACAYCPQACRPARSDGAGGWPRPGAVRAALDQRLRAAGPLDSITVSGCGEPGLHPRFGAVLAEVLAAARLGRPEVPVRILSNGTPALRPEGRRALAGLDERILKLDAGSGRVERPETGCGPLRRADAYAALPDVTVQACFVEGEPGNCDDDSVAVWLELMAALRPRAVQVYTIGAAPGRAGPRPASAALLARIVRALRRRGLVPAPGTT